MAFDPDAPSVLTSDVYNDAEVSFAMLQSKEKLVSFLDCTTLLRSMGMNPTRDDMDRLKELMAEPISRLEQWRREEELRQDKERRKEEARDRKGKDRASVAPAKKSIVKEGGGEENGGDGAAAAAASITPAEEIKNIDWNIFIHCAEMVFRDRMREEHAVAEALKVFAGSTAATLSRDRLMEIVTTNGDNVLTPAEVKVLLTMLPEACTVKELAARIQGTYVAPTQAEIDAAAMRDLELQRQQEAAEKAKEEENDPLKGL